MTPLKPETDPRQTFVVVQPVAIWLDQPDPFVKALTGGRSAEWLRDQIPNGLPVRKRGIGSASRYFVFPEELKQYLLDTSTIAER